MPNNYVDLALSPEKPPMVPENRKSENKRNSESNLLDYKEDK